SGHQPGAHSRGRLHPGKAGAKLANAAITGHQLALRGIGLGVAVEGLEDASRVVPGLLGGRPVARLQVAVTHGSALAMLRYSSSSRRSFSSAYRMRLFTVFSGTPTTSAISLNGMS